MRVPARRALRVPLLLAGPVPGRAGGVPGLRVAGPIARGAGAVTLRGLWRRVPLAVAGRGLGVPRLLIAWRALPVSGRGGAAIGLLLWRGGACVGLLLLLWRGHDEPCGALARVGKEDLADLVPAGGRRRRG